MKDEIAKKVQGLRKEAAMTQTELSKGICTQAQISNIEKGHLNPSSLTLFRISKKLNVDMNYFFAHSEEHEREQLQSWMNSIRAFVQVGNYEEVRVILQQEEEMQWFQLKQSKPFILWHEGLCLFHLDKKVDSALQTLKEALQLSKEQEHITHQYELKIREDISVLLFQMSKVEEAFSSYSHLKQLIDSRADYQKSDKMKIRTYLGLARCTYKMNLFRDAITFSKRGVEVSLGNSSLIHLAELLLTQGNSLIQLKETEEGINKLHKAKLLFELEDKQKQLSSVNQVLNQIEVNTNG